MVCVLFMVLRPFLGACVAGVTFFGRSAAGFADGFLNGLCRLIDVCCMISFCFFDWLRWERQEAKLRERCELPEESTGCGGVG